MEDGTRFNFLTLVKGEERYIFAYRDVYRKEMLQLLVKYAMDEELSFNWKDAAMTNKMMQELTQAALIKNRFKEA